MCDVRMSPACLGSMAKPDRRGAQVRPGRQHAFSANPAGRQQRKRKPRLSGAVTPSRPGKARGTTCCIVLCLRRPRLSGRDPGGNRLRPSSTGDDLFGPGAMADPPANTRSALTTNFVKCSRLAGEYVGVEPTTRPTAWRRAPASPLAEVRHPLLRGRAPRAFPRPPSVVECRGSLCDARSRSIVNTSLEQHRASGSCFHFSLEPVTSRHTSISDFNLPFTR